MMSLYDHWKFMVDSFKLLILVPIMRIYKRCCSPKLTNSVNILYQSNNFLIVEKPYDLVINSNDENRKYTLQSELRKLLPHLVNPKLCHEFHFVHRLDHATSGAMCIALNKESAQAASVAFEKRKVKKYYLALVHGHINCSHLTINVAIGEDIREREGNHSMCTSDDIFCHKPKKSSTLLFVLERGFWANKPVTKVLLYPQTGRRHQLRVHCHSIGHTIVGDYIYSKGEDSEPHRMFLHSFRLILETEIENVDVKTEDPFDSANPNNPWKITIVNQKVNENLFSSMNKLVE